MIFKVASVTIYSIFNHTSLKLREGNFQHFSWFISLRLLDLKNPRFSVRGYKSGCCNVQLLDLFVQQRGGDDVT